MAETPETAAVLEVEVAMGKCGYAGLGSWGAWAPCPIRPQASVQWLALLPGQASIGSDLYPSHPVLQHPPAVPAQRSPQRLGRPVTH